ncbi:capsid protein [Chifec genomovirus UA13_98]|nr:capsid protein [Chifec genomovirus UA13_98]
MGYRRTSTRRAKRSYTRRSATKSRSAPRRSYGRKRTYTKRRSMSKKGILNLTSRKKRDTMLTWSNTSSGGGQQTTAQNPAFVNGINGGFFLWAATARDLTTGTSLSTISLESARTATTCYMRGLSEKVRIQTNSGIPWFHRRICFTYKGQTPFLGTFSGDTGASNQFLENSDGMTRLWFNNNINGTPNYINQCYGVLFKGAQGVDWSDTITAPLDTRRVTVKYDKTWTMQSGNTNGIVRERKLWHPMNKNLVYDDDEAGTAESTSYVSTESKAGMGDYYVVDIIQAGTGGSTSDLLQIQSTTSLYWHEK